MTTWRAKFSRAGVSLRGFAGADFARGFGFAMGDLTIASIDRVYR
jgi:hypothetical protein